MFWENSFLQKAGNMMMPGITIGYITWSNERTLPFCLFKCLIHLLICIWFWSSLAHVEIATAVCLRDSMLRRQRREGNSFVHWKIEVSSILLVKVFLTWSMCLLSLDYDEVVPNGKLTSGWMELCNGIFPEMFVIALVVNCIVDTWYLFALSTIIIRTARFPHLWEYF